MNITISDDEVSDLWEDTRRRKYTDKIELHILELPKIAKHDYPRTELLNWMRLMNLSADEEKQLEYEARQKAIMDHDYLMRYNWEEGMKVGIKAGMVETCKELGLSKEKTVEKLMQKFDMQKEEAVCVVEEYWEKTVEVK